MNNILSKIAILTIFLTFTLTSCGVFKKSCNCPKVNTAKVYDKSIKHG